ncbi:MAG: LpqB family beta-propeller domain-containing protein [Dermatophilaceae bacterium]
MTRRRGIPPSATGGRRRLARGLVASGVTLLAGLMVLGGCGLPTTGPVVAGRPVDENVIPQARVVVPAPAPGAGPGDIVRGFLQAGAAFQETGDRSAPVAVSYLAAASVSRWRPTSSVTVYDRNSPLVIDASVPGTATVSVPAVATVDEGGRYRELAPGTTATLTLGLVQEQGEWRVQLPDGGFGMWLSTDDFGRLFEAFRISYAAVGAKRLVPDVRWFPLGPRLATALARAQLGPVPDYLKGAAETGVPDGTRLAVDAVAVEGGVATVVLTSAATSADVGRRAQMWAQFVATLTQAAGVQSVALEVQGSGRLSLQEVRSPVASVQDLGYSTAVTAPTRALVRLGDQLVPVDPTRLDEGSTAPAAGLPELPTVGAGVGALAISADYTDLAGLSSSGLVRWHARVPERVDVPGTVLAPPAYDSRGRLWVGGQSSTGQVWTLDAAASGSAAESVDAPWLGTRAVLALAPSGDGTRLAVVSRGADPTDTQLDVAGIVRDPTGRPTALAKGYRQGEPLRRISSVTWVGDLTLAVLAVDADGGQVRPYVVDVGQGVGLRRRGIADPRDTLVAPVDGARRVVSTGGLRGLVVVTDEPRVKARSGGGWRVVGSASDLLMPPSRPS